VGRQNHSKGQPWFWDEGKEKIPSLEKQSCIGEEVWPRKRQGFELDKYRQGESPVADQ